MLIKCKINSLAVTNQVSHFCKTTVVFRQVPNFHLVATKSEPNHAYTQKERKLTFSNIVTSLSLV